MKQFDIIIKPYSECAILIEWPQIISNEILEDILSFKNVIEKIQGEKIAFFNHAYCSMLIFYNNRLENFSDLKERLEHVYAQRITSRPSERRLWQIPVCYHNFFALDMDFMSAKMQLSKEEIIALHSQPLYTLFFTGFLPGFMYLGGLAEVLHFSRKGTPRMVVPKGAVAIGGKQTGIYPSDSPGGWQIIGNSPLSFFDVSKPKPCFAKAGDKIKFKPISLDEHQHILQLVEARTFKLESEVFLD